MRLRLGPAGPALRIRPRFSSPTCWRRRGHQANLIKQLCLSRELSSEDEPDSLSAQRGKCCASCKTQKTPLWRIAEDGTPLCNACGIRYKKYRIRCFRCWNIPRKNRKLHSWCPKCGERLHLAVAMPRSRKRKGDDDILTPPIKVLYC
ncbi:GATA-type zinc finger protein 1 [Alligator mississippiensis]|uniref:GATA-type zinc finger protein 1 n=1 Tax=Alligator mississippiensis TaxID=8496 RepID=A0A151N0W2_ALLMI|nr:GATA-type zinc finger protein 1 [Alligator mississippiensis]